MTTLALDTLTVHTSEAHVRAVCLNFGLFFHLEGSELVVSRQVSDDLTLTYRAPVLPAVAA